MTNRKRYRPVFEQYAGKMFKASKEKYADEHREELDAYRAAVRYFKAHPERENADTADLVNRHKELKAAIAAENDKLSGLKAQMEPFGKISYYFSRIYAPRPSMDEQSGRAETHKEQIVPPESPRKRRRSEPSL